MGSEPIIRRSLFGLIVLILVGFAIAAAIYGLAYFVYTGNSTDLMPVAILQLMATVILIATLITAIVYNLHSMTLNDSGVTIKNWGSLFYSSETHCDWNEIEDLNIQRAGLFSIFGGYDEIIIQTASAEARMKFKYCPGLPPYRLTPEL